jgi:crotonobetainyl-CoA:carnitine CoA-transferase CaiB-like acyl-CoA transferase
MNLPLEGIKVLDFTQYVIGPVCTQLLGKLGADIIKIEPLQGDGARITPSGADSTLFIACNAGKRSIAINLKEKKGVEIIFELAKNADVIIENFRPGVMNNLGIGYEVISKINSKIIYTSLSMYGHVGPLARRRGADPWAQAFTGVVAGQGSPDEPPYLAGHAFMDTTGALTASFAIVTALLVREKTGMGQEITSNLVSAGLFAQTTTFGYTLIDGVLLKKGGRGTARGQFPYGAYPAKDGDVVTIFGQDDHEWPIFCSILGIEHLLADPKYQTAKDRTERKKELYPVLDEAFRKKTRDEWAQLFKENGLRCDPCLDYQEVLDHPQFKALDLIVEVDHPVRGKIKTLLPPIDFKGFPRSKFFRHPPVTGEHTREILSELRYKAKEIDEFIKHGYVGVPTASMLKRQEVEKGPPVSIDLGKGAKRSKDRIRS